MEHTLTIWQIGDGKPGHENQSRGLAEAIARRRDCEIHRISIAGVKGTIRRVRRALLGSTALPAPDLVIAAGHGTHPSLLWLARKHRARAIVLMRPSLPMSWFDLCIAPAHDFPQGHGRKNLILTQGALHRVSPPADSFRSGGMILIGGPSSSHGWNSAALLQALEHVTAQAGKWELTDSRRTPADFTAQVRQHIPNARFFSHQETPPDWLPSKLATAAQVWVTEDSVSMIYEALGSGAQVGLLPVPRRAKCSRVLRGVGELVEKGFLTPYESWQKTGGLLCPPEILREADRCAAELLRRFFPETNGAC